MVDIPFPPHNGNDSLCALNFSIHRIFQPEQNTTSARGIPRPQPFPAYTTRFSGSGRPAFSVTMATWAWPGGGRPIYPSAIPIRRKKEH